MQGYEYDTVQYHQVPVRVPVHIETRGARHFLFASDEESQKTPPGRPTMTRKERPHLVTAAWKSVGDVYKGLAKAISSALSSQRRPCRVIAERPGGVFCDCLFSAK